MNYILDNTSSKLTIRTRAEGLLARLAHDLSLVAPLIEGHVELDGEAWSATLTVAPSLFVEGILKAGRVDTSVLSSSDRQQIDQRVRDEILRRKSVRVEVRGVSRSSGRATITVADRCAEVQVELRLPAQDDGSLRVEGHVELSLQALGVAPIKGPLNAFKVADVIVVHFALGLREAP